MKKSLKKFMSVGVSLVILGTMLAACGGKTTPAASTAVTTAPASPSAAATASPAATTQSLKEVTLKIFLPGDDRSAKADVLNALYEQTKDRINAKFEINFIPFGDYQNKLTLLAASGDNYDAAFTADWFGYATMVNKGAFLNLSDLAPKYAPNLYKFYKDNNILSNASVNGQLMALPWTEIKTSKPIFEYRQDIADKLNVKPGDLTTIEGIDAFLTAIAKAKPGMTPFDMHMGGAGLNGDILALLAPKYEFMDMGFHSLFMDLNDPAHKVLPIEQTPMFKEAVQLAKKWYDAGIIDKNALNEKATQLFPNSKAFAGKNTSGDLYEKINFTDKSAVAKALEVYPDKKFARDSQMNNAMAINKSAANPERMLMFMDLLSTDKAVYDTFFYGIKDKTYSVDDKGIVGFAAGEDPAKPLWQGWFSWGFYRTDFTSPTVSRPLDAIKAEKDYATRPNILVSPISGLVPATDAVKTELAQRDQIASEQGRLLLGGIVKGDVDAAITAYVAKQKAAGLDKVLVEVQKQVDAFAKK